MLLFVIGIYVLAVGKVQFSSTRGLVGGKARGVGAAFLLASLIPIPPVSLTLFVGGMIYAGVASEELPAE